MKKDMFENMDLRLLDDMFEAFVQFLPRLLLAVLFLLLCWVILKVAMLVLGKLLKFSKIDAFVNNLKNEVLKGDNRIEASKVIMVIVKWFLIFVFVLIGSDLLGLTIVSRQISRLLDYLPQFFSGLAIFVIGVYLAVLARKLVIKTMHSIGWGGTKITGNLLSTIIIVFVLMTALNQMGINTDFITDNLSIIIGSFFIAIGLAFSLGSKNIVQKILFVFYARRIFKVGDKVVVNGVEGMIVAIDNLCFTILSGNEKIVFPIDNILNGETKIL